MISAFIVVTNNVDIISYQGIECSFKIKGDFSSDAIMYVHHESKR